MNKEPERNPRKALGKGLSALLPSRNSAPASPDPAAASIGVAAAPAVRPELPGNFQAFESIPLDQIQPSIGQPRSSFDSEKLNELAESIRANGVIQPITVRQDGPGTYRIIAGERRWRAAQIAALTTIPALIRTADEHEQLELALIENLQREDLNPIEIATAFQRLVDEHKLSHEQIAQRTGKDRSTVTNFLRLLKSSPFVRSALANGQVSMGHARALLNVPSETAQDALCRDVIDRQLSVRHTEMLVKVFLEGPPEKERHKPAESVPPGSDEDPNVRAAIAELEAALGTRVRLTRKPNGGGRLEIEFYSADDLDRIYAMIVKQ